MVGIHIDLKVLVVGIVFLFIAVAVHPSIGILNNRDDKIPPVTTLSFTPPEPDGENGWYVSIVTVTLNATDDDSGVNLTRYRIDEVSWEIYTEPFTLSKDADDIVIEYFSVDIAGNIEPVKNATIDIDQTRPLIALNYTVEGNFWRGYDIILIATTTDCTSGMNRVEFYYNDILQETMIGPGPEYVWVCLCPHLTVIGLIRNLEITDEYVKFYAVVVRIKNLWNPWFDYIVKKAVAYDNAGNWDYDEIENPIHPASIEPGLYLFQNVTLPNNFTGYIGRFFIKATFNN